MLSAARLRYQGYIPDRSKFHPKEKIGYEENLLPIKWITEAVSSTDKGGASLKATMKAYLAPKLRILVTLSPLSHTFSWYCE